MFASCEELLRQTPFQVEDRTQLRHELAWAAGGVIFTTIQKVLPEEKGDAFPQLPDRRNIVVIADEAHRSQYGFIEGFARYVRDALPRATFLGFTGTPVELEERDTRVVFGDYIDIYDVQRAVEDGATVPIYYESRLAKLGLPESEKPQIDEDFKEVTEGEEVARKERLKNKWAQLEAVVGSARRLEMIARAFSEILESALRNYQARAITTVQVFLCVTPDYRIPPDEAARTLPARILTCRVDIPHEGRHDQRVWRPAHHPRLLAHATRMVTTSSP